MKFDSEKIKATLEPIEAALGLAVVGPAGETPEVLTGSTVEEGKTPAVIGNGTVPVLIKDVHLFKAGLQLSTGVKPVKDLSEFVEGDAKL